MRDLIGKRCVIIMDDNRVNAGFVVEDYHAMHICLSHGNMKNSRWVNLSRINEIRPLPEPQPAPSWWRRILPRAAAPVREGVQR